MPPAAWKNPYWNSMGSSEAARASSMIEDSPPPGPHCSSRVGKPKARASNTRDDVRAHRHPQPQAQVAPEAALQRGGGGDADRGQGDRRQPGDVAPEAHARRWPPRWWPGCSSRPPRPRSAPSPRRRTGGSARSGSVGRSASRRRGRPRSGWRAAPGTRSPRSTLTVPPVTCRSTLALSTRASRPRESVKRQVTAPASVRPPPRSRPKPSEVVTGTSGGRRSPGSKAKVCS